MSKALGSARRLAAIGLHGLALWCAAAGMAHAQGAAPSNSDAQAPRFVSLKSDRVNLRQGPGTEYPTAWVFRRAGLPVEVIQEFESWRQVRDAEGTRLGAWHAC